MEKKSEVQSFLQGIFLFKDLADDSLEELAAVSSIFSLDKGQLLFLQGNSSEAFYILKSGRVTIFKVSKNGEEQTLHYHTDGDIIAEASIFDLQIYPASCRALLNSTFLKIPKSSFISLIKKRPEMAMKMMGAYSKRLRGFVSMVEYLTLDDVKLRILKYFSRKLVKRGEKYFVNLDISKKEIASLLGTVPETFSRNFKKLKEEKIIFESDQGIEILDHEKFHQLIE